MLRKLLPFVLFLLPSVAFGQTATVTGHALFPSGGAPTNAKVCFSLQNFKPNLPRVVGTGVLIQQQNWCIPVSSVDGSFSVPITRNDFITPVGTFWRVDYSWNGSQQSSATYIINKTPFNLDTEIPLSQSVAAGPAQLVTQSFTCANPAAATTWTCTHNLNNSTPIVEVYSASGTLLDPTAAGNPYTVQATSANVITITFTNPQAGTATILQAGAISIATNQPNAVLQNPPGAQTVQQPLTLTGPLNSNNLTTGNVANKPAVGDAIRYVTANGNDSNDGLSWGTAKATVLGAYNSLPTTSYVTCCSFTYTNVPVGTINLGFGTFSISSFVEGGFVQIRGVGQVGTVLQCTQTSGYCFQFNHPYTNVHVDGVGLYDLQLDATSTSGSASAIVFGCPNYGTAPCVASAGGFGSIGDVVQNVYVDNAVTGTSTAGAAILELNNTIMANVSRSTIAGNPAILVPVGLGNFGEDNHFTDNWIQQFTPASNFLNCVVLNSAGEFFFRGGSIDGCQITMAPNGTVNAFVHLNLTGIHIEAFDIASERSNPIISSAPVGGGAVLIDLNGVSLQDDNVTLVSKNALIISTGGATNITIAGGEYFTPALTIPAVVQISAGDSISWTNPRTNANFTQFLFGGPTSAIGGVNGSSAFGNTSILPVNTGNNVASNPLNICARDSGGVISCMGFTMQPNGFLNLARNGGGGGLNVASLLQQGGIPVTVTIGSGTATTNGTAIATLTSQAQPAITATGALATDTATCSLNAAMPASWQTGIQMLPPVVTANTVTVWLSNPTATANITPAATAIRCTVTR